MDHLKSVPWFHGQSIVLTVILPLDNITVSILSLDSVILPLDSGAATSTGPPAANRPRGVLFVRFNILATSNVTACGAIE